MTYGSSDDEPYIVPVNFGFEGNSLYFHCAPEGRKVAAIKTNPRVCFEVENGSEVIASESACGFSARYRSIIGYGNVRILESAEEREQALSIIMQKYASGKPAYGRTWVFDQKQLDRLITVRIDIESMTGKQSGDWEKGAL